MQFLADVAIVATEPDEDGSQQPPRVDITAYTGGIMSVPGFGRVVVDLAGMEHRDKVTLLADHNNRLGSIVGSGTPAITDGQLRVSGTIASTSNIGQHIIALSREGVGLQASIGAAPLQVEKIARGKSITVNGRDITATEGSFLLVKASRLREVSIVANGADDNTSVGIAASLSEGIEMNFAEWLKAKGFDIADLSDEQKAVLKAAYEAENAPSEPDTDPVEPPPATPDVASELRAAAAAEHERISSIGRSFASNPHWQEVTIEANGEEVSLQSHAIAEGWDLSRAELEAFRRSTTTAPAAHISQRDTDASLQAMQGAALLRAVLALDSPVWQSQSGQ